MEKGKKKIGLVFIFIIMQFSLFLSVVQASGKVNCQMEDFNLNAERTDATGVALLCETSRGLFGRASVMDLIPGNAYTVWWAYFDDTSGCVNEDGTKRPCGGPETAGENPIAVFGRMSSFVAPENGHVHFKGVMRDFKPSEDSQMTILMIDHGTADMNDKRRLARQLLTPEVPRFGAPHLGNDVDGVLGTIIGGAQFIMP